MNEVLRYELEKSIMAAEDAQSVVNAPFSTLGPAMIELGAIVLLIVNDKDKTVDRIALSNTEPAAGAVRMSSKPFHEIKIPLSTSQNEIASAILTDSKKLVTDWKYLFTPELTAKEARDNQNGAGIMCSVVAPLRHSDRRGALIFSFLCPASEISDAHHEFIDVCTELISTKL